MSSEGWNLETATSLTSGGSSLKTRLRLSSTIFLGLFPLHLGLHPLGFLKTLLPFALRLFLALSGLQSRLDLLGINEPLLDNPGLQHGNQVGKEVIVAQSGRQAVTDEVHHDRHHPHAHEPHRSHLRIVTSRLRSGCQLRIEEHRDRHQESEKGDMVTKQRHSGAEVDD